MVLADKVSQFRLTKTHSSMKTVETKVETLETAVEMLMPTGELADVSMGDFLFAHEKFRNPISKERLRDILDRSKNKYDLPKLWLIYRAYNWLAKSLSHGYQEELSVVCWTIEGIVLKELEHPENDTLEQSLMLYKAAPHGGVARSTAHDMLKKHFRAPLDWDKSLDDLIKVRRDLRLPPEFSHIGEELNKMIHTKALDGIRIAMKPESKLSYLEMKGVQDGVGLTYEERLSTLKEVVELTDKIETLLLAIGHIQSSMIGDKHATESEKTLNRRSLELGNDAWCKLMRLSGNREFMWRAIEETGWLEGFHVIVVYEAMVRLMKDFMVNFSATHEELQKFEQKDREFNLYDHRRHSEFAPLITKAYKQLILGGDKAVVKAIYDQFAGDNISSWRGEIKIAAVLRLYELSPSK